MLALGQTSLGTVAGSVFDRTGATIADAQVELTNTGTGIVRTTTTTNSFGIYRFDAVDLGLYNLKISQPGFASHYSTALRVEANRTTTVNATLTIGTVDTIVEVNAETADLLVKDAPLRGGNFSPQEVSRLPLSRLEPITLAATLPGVVAATGSTIFGPTGIIVGFSVNGQRPRGNNYLLDGTDNNDITFGGNAQPFSIDDAVEEVSVQTANFGVEFGRASGGIFNVITKSGTNAYHATLFWQYQSQAFNSRSNLDQLNASPRSVFSHNVYGFTLGGPWRKNKTFFFAAFQEDTFHSTRNYSFVVPTADSVIKLRGLFPANPRLDLYLSALGDLRGSANLKLLPLGLGRGSIAVGSAVVGIPLTDQGPQWMFRVDHNLTEAQRLSFRYIYDRRKTSPAITEIPGVPATVPFPGYMAEQDVGHQNFLAIHNFTISPQWTNEFRFSLGHISSNWPGEVSSRSIPLAFTLSRINIPNIDTPGLSGVFPAFLYGNSWLFQETQSKLSGRHTLRYGADFLRQLTRQRAALSLRGTITYTQTPEFSGFANFLDDFSGPSGEINRSFGNAFYHPNQFRQAYFFQDAWKARPSFTLTAGLRYENFGQPANVFRFPAFAGFDPSKFLIPNHVKRYDRNFAPAIGLTWSPTPSSRLLRELLGEGKTVWRTGYQVSYETFTNELIDGILSASPNTLSALVVGSGVGRGTPNWFAQLPTAGSPVMATDPQDGVLDKELRSPYTERWSFGFQRELPHSVLLDLSYVGAESHHLFVREDRNPRQLTGVLLFPQLGPRIVISSAGNSAYHGLQFSAQRRFARGIQMSSSYTWSRNIDSASESFATRANPGLGLTSVPASQGGLKLDRGLSDYHRGQRLSMAFFWELPGTRQGILSHVFAGWAISGIATFQSGIPYTVRNGFDRNNDGIPNDRPDIGNPDAPLNTRAVLSATCATGYFNPDTDTCVTAHAVHFIEGVGLPTSRTVGRNTLLAGGTNNWDLSLAKKLVKREGKTLEFRWEAFNVFNHPQFVNPPDARVLGAPGPAGGLPSRFLSRNFTDGGIRTMRGQLKFAF